MLLEKEYIYLEYMSCLLFYNDIYTCLQFNYVSDEFTNDASFGG